MPRCKHCKQVFTKIRWNQKFCLDPECVKAWVADAKDQNWKKTKKKMQADIETTQDVLKAAQMVFNKYIRLRDHGLNCISCDKPAKKENCGHYYSQGGHSNVRFDEDNCHLQCEHCNTYLSGNLLNYQIGIERRIGAEKLIELQGRAHLEKRWGKEELSELIQNYKQKIKDLEKS
jgi:hypothetical protein